MDISLIAVPILQIPLPILRDPSWVRQTSSGVADPDAGDKDVETPCLFGCQGPGLEVWKKELR